MELSGRVAIITGATSGIGRAIALYLAEAGANVVVSYRKSNEVGQEVVEQIKRKGRGPFAENRFCLHRRQVLHCP